ncbi:hypothetical protein [uncultured Acinetobacter sp.]|uniref:hypothetical protein n=1 Tax=uncultured Acinetobacter sp. TaxID=165433 RepID=UPI0025EB63AC|nr:hypothetical protein [uncultured Acinetobacter sp.]
MIKYRYLGLFVFSLITTEMIWAKPCASSGGRDKSDLHALVPITELDLINSLFTKKTLSDTAFKKAAAVAQAAHGSNVNIGMSVFQPVFTYRGVSLPMNLPFSFDGQSSIGNSILHEFTQSPPTQDPWKCDPRENTRWEPCCQECANEGIAEWYEVKFLFNRGFILHNQEKIARKKATRHIIYI